MHLVTIVNGPGELTGWMLPVVERFRQAVPGATVTAVIAPCQFASGRESHVAQTHPGIDRTLGLGEFVRLHWKDRLGTPEASDQRPLVLHFGGDRMYARLVASLLRAPVWRYGTSARGWHWADRFFVPDARVAEKFEEQGVDRSRVSVVGQLVVDNVRQTLGEHAGATDATGEAPRIVFLPGSRHYEVELMLPFFIDVIDRVAAAHPGARCVVSRSSFVAGETFFAMAARAGYRLDRRDDGPWLRTPAGTPCRLAERNWMSEAAGAAVAVTLPGTNTLQLAALGVPTIVLLPLNWAERVPLEGLPGLLLPSALPFGLLKRHVVRLMNRWVRFIALPNILASEEVVPELRGVLRQRDVAAALIDLVGDPERRDAMSARLRAIAGPPGAADRIVEALLDRQESLCASGS